MSTHGLHATGVAGDPTSIIHGLDPRAKLIGLVGITVVGVTTPAPAWPVLGACAAVLAVVAISASVPARIVAGRARVVLPLVALVAISLPFTRGGEQLELGPFSVSQAGLVAFGLVSAKALVGTVSAVLLGATTSFPDVLHALERLRAPRLLTLIAALMYRYLFVIADEARRMRVALAARGYRPRTALQAGALGRVAIALFLRSYERAERVHLAMLARGYAGTMPRLGTLAIRRADVAFVAVLALALLPLRVALQVTG